MSSKILNVFPDETGENRLVLVQESCDGGETQLVLQQESRSPHVGWFVQSRISIGANQVAGLKMTLTSNLADQLTRDEVAQQDQESPATINFRTALAG